MTTPPGDSRLAGWRPSPYQAAVVLSGVSAVLGLGRELLVLKRLGVSAANDQLQFALSVTYTVALLGEPLRLAALNLLQRHLGVRLWSVIGAGVVLAAAVTTALYGYRAEGIPFAWLVIAGAAGAANLLLAWVLPRRQRAGPFLLVHTITVLPSYIIVAGLLIPAGSGEAFAERVVGLFLLAPLLQLAALAVVQRFGDHHELGPPPSVREGLRPMAWHAVGAGGGQVSQLLMRSSLLLAPAGTLTAFMMVLRVTETLRAIFVDTYIASRVKRWAAGERSTSPVIDGRWLSAGALAAVVAAALVLAVGWSGRGPWISAATGMLVIGAYFVLALRVRYQLLNTSAQPIPLVRRMAGLELLAAGLVLALTLLPVPLALLPWVLYVAKPAAGLRLVAVRPESAPALTPEA